MSTTLSQYTLLGRSGLRVSPLALGTMTFGTEWGWGSPKETAFEMLARYLDQGGNIIDTADGYTGGTSESFIGEFFATRGGRDRAVLATKYTLGSTAGDPNSGGNGRKNLYRALEGSLKRLRTDYVDLLWVHAWDGITPVEEVIESLTDLQRAGRVRYVGLSDVPAWYFARAQSIAEAGRGARVVALQLEYSLVERNIEREHIPAAVALGAAVMPWSPLGSGMLTGKYQRQGTSPLGAGRLPALAASGNPGFTKLFTERNWAIVDALKRVAGEVGRSPAQVALAWIRGRPGVVAPIVGATKIAQLEDNLASLSLDLTAEQHRVLDELSAPDLVHPYQFFATEFFQSMLSGQTSVSSEPEGFRSRL